MNFIFYFSKMIEIIFLNCICKFVHDYDKNFFYFE